MTSASTRWRNRARPSTGHAWTVTLHRDWASLEPAWRELETDGRCTPFQCFDWVAAWYAATGRHGLAEPFVVTVEDADGLVWILPLCRHRWKGLNFISFADLGVSDYAAPVMARNDRVAPADLPALLKAIVRAFPPCDLVHFQKLPTVVGGLPNPLMQLDGLIPMREKCYGIVLDRKWEELAKDIMQSRQYRTIRQQKRKISEIGPLNLEQCREPDAIGEAMPALMAMRRERFAAIGRADMPDAWREFYSDVAATSAPGHGFEVEVTTLRVADQPVAMCYGLVRGKIYYALIPTFAAEWDSFRPGLLMFDAMLQELGPRTDFAGYFDFTIGDEPYKGRFGATAHPLLEHMAPRSAKGALAYMYWRAKASRRKHS